MKKNNVNGWMLVCNANNKPLRTFPGGRLFIFSSLKEAQITEKEIYQVKNRAVKVEIILKEEK